MIRVGLFGLLGSGNLGNDGSLESVLRFLRAEHPEARLTAFCGGPDIVSSRYGIDATALNWYAGEYRTASGVRAVALKGLGKLVDVWRTAAWVRRQDIVIVPGMGVLEATLPLRPWGFPYSLLLLTLAGRLFGTKVALVSVGANVIEHRATRTIVKSAGRLAAYRSYRDAGSRESMREMGVDTSRDEVYPDLVFALPAPPPGHSTGVVGVGVMAFRGGNDERERAEQIYRSYVDGMKGFVHRLVEQGRPVRLFSGDQVDSPVVDEILAECGPLVSASSASSLDAIMREMAAVDSVVATRYHNVLCALKAGKPTISVGYAAKNEELMAGMGLGEYCLPARSVDVDELIERFIALERRSDGISTTLAECNAAAGQRIKHQFAALTAVFEKSR
ncbi:polysaccharide pyruvyl transferase family protein [Amycolatopsis alkalitolerans]|uniref:polysaccharide pyruvyl transferase family protein n=1 Tax=Amycolatopsis alkalitolerans TaxID=2547244 RepID=UPI00190F8414|nr:polysaccharide pyruvyl transferase family protein [Amycolatopsis alkalitolerans]